MKRQLIAEIISYLFILLFVYAATSKLLDVEKFRIQIGQSPILTNIAYPVSWIIPIGEMIVSLMLAIPRFRLLGLYLSFFLMVMFTAYIASVLQLSEQIPCACGGVLQALGWKEHLVFNIFFVLLAIVGTVVQSRKHNYISPQ